MRGRCDTNTTNNKNKNGAYSLIRCLPARVIIQILEAYNSRTAFCRPEMCNNRSHKVKVQYLLQNVYAD